MTDWQGSVRDLVQLSTLNGSTPQPSVTKHLDYDSFGNTIRVTDGSGQPSTLDTQPSTRFLYTARELDPETGLQYNRARYYDTAIGRFLSEDPIRDDSSNLYRYVHNDPENRTDPSGLGDIQVHFWTVYLLSRKAGKKPWEAYQLAYYSQLPDQVREYEAVWVRKDGDTHFNRLVYEVLHSLHGGDPHVRRGLLRRIATNYWDQWDTWQQGFFLHAYADAFFHTAGSGADETAYGWDAPGCGHLWQGHGPDTYAWNSDKSERFLDDFLTLFKINDEAERSAARQEILAPMKVNSKATRLSRGIRAFEIETLRGIAASQYEFAEKWWTPTLDEYGVAPGHGLPTPSHFEVQRFLQNLDDLISGRKAIGSKLDWGRKWTR